MKILLRLGVWIVVLAVAGVAAWVILQRESLASRPVVVRANVVRADAERDWKTYLTPSQGTYRYDPAAFPKTTIKRTTTSLTISMPPRNQPQQPQTPEALGYPYRVLRLSGGASAKLDDGTVQLDYIGCGYIDDRAVLTGPGPYAQWQVPFQTFSADGKPVEAATLRARGLGRAGWSDKDMISAQYGNGFPSIKLALRLENLKHFEIIGFKLLDGATHRSLWDGGDSTTRVGDEFVISINVCTWRPGPIQIILDVAHGDPLTIEKDAVDGAEFKFPFVAARLLSLAPGGQTSWNSGSQGRDTTVDWSSWKTAAGECIAVVQTDLNPHPSLKIDALTSAGISLTSRGSSSSETSEFRYQGNVGQIARLRATCLPEVDRLVIDLPEIPGLPEANRGITDLMEMKVPYARISQDYDWDRVIGVPLELNLVGYRGRQPSGFPPRRGSTGPPGSSPAIAYPIEMRNTTMREILARYDAMYPTHYLQSNEAAGELRFVFPGQSWLDRMVARLGL